MEKKPEAVRKKKNRKSISLAVKLEVINRIQNGQRSSQVSRDMGLPPSTVRTIYKDSARIRECCENVSSLSSKVISRKRSKIMERLERDLCKWIESLSQEATDVTMTMIQLKAVEMFKQLQEQEPDDSPDKKERFSASRGWFDRFKRRQHLHLSAFGYERVIIGAVSDLELGDHILPGDYGEVHGDGMVQDESDEPIEAAHEFLDFQMVVDENNAGDLNQAESEEVQNYKMTEARTSMVDIQIEPKLLSDPDARSKIFQDIEGILSQSDMKKKHEDIFGQSHIILYSNESGSLTSTLKTYPFGLITITFEHCPEETAVTNSNLETMRKTIINKLKAKAEAIPAIKRGTSVPVYFTSADERILEYDFNKVLVYEDSPYQNIKILHSPTLGNCLILDDLQNLAECDINYTHGVMKYGVISYTGKDVLILGGGDGGLLHELLKENPKYITMVDIDKMVVDACREHLRGCCGDSLDKLEGSNYKVIIDDCLKLLDQYKSEGRKFDIVINDLTDIPIATTPQGELWDFIKKILIKSLAVLKDDGSYLNHAIGEGCVEALKNYENVLSNLPEKVTFSKHSSHVPSFMENWVFYEVKKV